MVTTIALLAAFTVQGMQSPGLAADAPPISPRTYFLIVGKSRVADPIELQERSAAAVQKVAKAAGKCCPGATVDALAERVMTPDQYRRGQVPETVTGAIFRERLRKLAEIAAPQDTVVVYTHSHGLRNGFEKSQPLGGIVFDLPIQRPEHGGAILWDEYADLILNIPARNVVVLTMSCYSGGLVEYLDSPTVRGRWEDRSHKEGRNLVVLTSQSEDLTSEPILKQGEAINPFTHAVVGALEGTVHGPTIITGQPTIGAWIDSIRDATRNTPSESVQRPNTARPALTGSYDREDFLFNHCPK